MKPLKPASLVMTALLAGGIVSVRAQGTAFTYQGRLRDNTIPAVGVFDLRFALYDVPSGGPAVGSPVTANDVAVTNGLFCVVLDFGVNAFTGAERWLETSLRPGADETGDYTVLAPRRRLTATPYALYAPNAGTAGTAISVPTENLTGTVPLARLPGEVVTNNEAGLTLSGTFSGNGAGLTAVNADRLDGEEGDFYQNAANLTDGTLSDARLSPNVAFLNANQAFSGSNLFAGDSLFSGVVRMTNAENLVVGTHAGNGANLSNLTAAFLIGTVPKATDFTGVLAGDVTGAQGDTMVKEVGGVTAVDVASGAVAANGATAAADANALVKRDAIGGFAAGMITATFAGPGSGLTALNASELASGTLPDARLSANVAFLNTNQVFSGSNMFAGDSLFAGPSRMTNSDNLLVGVHAGDGASLSNLTAAFLTGTAPKATDFTGLLAGDVTGTQGSTVVARVGGVTAVDVAFGANAANGATAANVADTIVKRDTTGSFAGNVTGTFSGDGSGLTNIKASSIVGTGGGGSTISLPSGITVVSLLPNDANLLASGYALMMTVPAPPWTTGSAVGGASARFGHSAIWDGQRLIIWGGRPVTGSVYLNYLNTGATYCADTDQWEAVSTVDAPVPRWGHTAVWTGSEMLVWGGNAATGRLNTGGRFQPNRQLWRAISATDVPSARTDHTAVWTGSQMFIWGGQDASGLLNDGGFYSPDTDQWSGVTAHSAPAARIGATAIWADDRVLIWGGEGEGGVLNSGSQLRFDTSTPYWFAMTSDNAPAPRRGHSAIWTGDRMIVWGGQRDGVPFGDGAAYDPATDSWEQLSASSAPAARFNHAAVWSGQEMLILGGSNSSGELASGAAYNPATGIWRPLSSSGSPLARTEATAIWAGTELLVFGGRAQGMAVASLQRLVPQPVWYFYRKL